ncbi:MAG: hypothetical protein Q8P07_01480 [bacterium]|nr:hypothetical protein [bacterium]
MKTVTDIEISQEIYERQNDILSNIDIESIDVYLWLRNEFKKGNILENTVFQFVFRSYYLLDSAGLGEKVKKRYFELLADKQTDLEKVLVELYQIETLRKRKTIQFSFATKLLHTIDNNNPIFDSKVARVIHRNVSGTTRDARVASCIEIYTYMKRLYPDLIKEERIKKVIEKFRTKFNVTSDKMPDIKILDFLIWSLGKLI